MKLNPRYLIWYELLASAFGLIMFTISFLFGGFTQLIILWGLVVSICGLIGGFLLLKSKQVGLYLSLFWAFVQIPRIFINTPSFKGGYQFFLGLEFHYNFIRGGSWGEISIGMNWFAIILIILFIKFRGQLLGIEEKKSDQTSEGN